MRLLLVPASALCLALTACSASSPSSAPVAPSTQAPSLALTAPTPEHLASLAATAQSEAGIDAKAAASLDSALAKALAAEPAPGASAHPALFTRSGFTVRQAVLSSEDSPAPADTASSATMLTLLASSQDMADRALSASGEDPLPMDDDSSFESGDAHVNVHREAGGSVGDASAMVSLDAHSATAQGKVDSTVSVNPCPDADGTFTFSVKNSASLSTGEATVEFSYAVDAHGSVSDEATLTALEMNVTTTSGTPSATTGYARQEQSLTLPYGSDGALWDEAHGSAAVTSAGSLKSSYAQSMTYMAQATALDAANRIADAAQAAWRSGRCVSLDAVSAPGDTSHLSPSQEVSLAVSAVSKVDGAPITSPVTASLSGPGSLSPTEAKTPAQLSFQASDEKTSHASAALRAVSKRGIANTAVDFSVASGPLPVEIVDYTTGSDVRDISGTNSHLTDDTYAGVVPGFQYPLVICDITKPFTLRTPSGTTGARGSFEFTPTSATSGTMHMEYVHGSGPVKGTLDSSGSYTLTGDLTSVGAEGMLVGDDKGSGKFATFKWTVSSHRAWPLKVREPGTACTQ